MTRDDQPDALNNFIGTGKPLTEGNFVGIIADTGLHPAALWAVLAVETRGCGYLADRRPKILFERHVFRRLTKGSFDDVDPDISNAIAGGYAKDGNEYLRLQKAIKLDASAALQSASWGLGQLMGENFTLAGFPTVNAFVSAIVDSEDAQLSAMLSFMKAAKIIAPLLADDWTEFARRYNGPNFAKNNYDARLRDCFTKFSSDGLPNLRVRAAQIYLTFRGYAPGPIDGLAKDKTTNAIKAFQRQNGALENGVLDDALLAQLSS